MATKQDFVDAGNQIYAGRDWWTIFSRVDNITKLYEELDNKQFYGTVRANLTNTSDPDDTNVESDGSFRLRWVAADAGKLPNGETVNANGGTETQGVGTYDQTKIYFGYIYVKAETTGQIIVPGVVSKDVIGDDDTKVKWQYDIVERDTSMTIFDSEGTPDLVYVAQTSVSLTKNQTVQVPDGGEYRASEDYSDTGVNFLEDYLDITKFSPINTITGTIQTVLYGRVAIQLSVAHRLSSNALK